MKEGDLIWNMKTFIKVWRDRNRAKLALHYSHCHFLISSVWRTYFFFLLNSKKKKKKKGQSIHLSGEMENEIWKQWKKKK